MVARPSRRRTHAVAVSAAALLGAVGVGWAMMPGPAPATSAPVESSPNTVVRSTTPSTAPPTTAAGTTTAVTEDRQPAGRKERPVPPNQVKDEKTKAPGKSGKGKP